MTEHKAAQPMKSEGVAKKQKSEKEGKPPSLWWAVGAYVAFAHVMAAYAVFFYPTNWKVYFATIVTCFFTAFGITAGYHRLWSHRAYTASLPLRIMLMLLGTNAFQGSIKWWVLRHRLHHRYTDTEDDPYSAAKGFWYSHMGWMFEKPYYPKMKLIDASDLNEDPVVRFQHKYIVHLLIGVGYVFPAIVGYICGDWLGGILWMRFVGSMYVWHATWSINSFAHWMGDRKFSEQISARDHLICCFLTAGEGYHNFHHEFPRDYRNGVHWYDYDPTKWAIRLWYWLGLAGNLHRTNKNTMQQAVVQTDELKISRERAKLDWGPEDADLPEMTYETYQNEAKKEGNEWIVIDKRVHDVSKFKDEHPGGAKLLTMYRGKDATRAYNGELNNHSRSADNIARMLRVARIVDTDESGKYIIEN